MLDFGQFDFDQLAEVELAEVGRAVCHHPVVLLLLLSHQNCFGMKLVIGCIGVCVFRCFGFQVFCFLGV